MASDLKKKNALSKLEALAAAQAQAHAQILAGDGAKAATKMPMKAQPFAPPSRVSPGLLGQTKASVMPGFAEKRPVPERATRPKVQASPGQRRQPQEFTVVTPAAMVRVEPSLSAKACDVKRQGDVVFAMEETSDGWIRTSDPAGWMLLDLHGQGGVGALLEASGTAPLAPLESEEAARPETAIVPMSFALEVRPEILPAHRFRVVCGAVMVRSAPSLEARACGVTRRGDTVLAVEETFDGWVRTLEPEGWILRDFRGHCGFDFLLERCGSAKAMVVPELADETGPHRFTVMAELKMMSEPVDEAEVLGTLAPGDVLSADTQTYHGWLRLANRSGWVRGLSDSGSLLVNCWYMKARTMNRILRSQAEEKAKREADAEAALARELEHSAEIWEMIASSAAASSTPPALAAHSGQLLEPTPLQTPVALSDAESFANFHGLTDFNFAQLPECEFRVVAPQVLVRLEPDLSGSVSGQLVQGEVVKGWEETFAGWVHLSGQPGWALRHIGEQDDRGVAMQMIKPPELLAVQEVSPGPPRRMFEVVYEPHVYILKEARSGGFVTGSRACGEFVLAEAQTYHGWVRLADNLGWMQSNSRRDGQLLRSVTALEHAAPLLALTDLEAEEREEERRAEEERRQKELEEKQKAAEEASAAALRELEEAAASGDALVFRAAIKAAKAKGVAKRDIARVNTAFSLSAS